MTYNVLSGTLSLYTTTAVKYDVFNLGMGATKSHVYVTVSAEWSHCITVVAIIVISLSKIRNRDWSYTRHVICTNNHC